MNKQLIALIATLSLLAIAGVALSSWVAFALFSVISLSALYLHSLDRIKPEHKPDPDGKELLEALELHKQQVTDMVNSLAGKIAVATQNSGLGRRT